MVVLPPLVFFDLDGTLAQSKQPLTENMAQLLFRLLKVTRVAVISGGALPQFLSQIVAKLPARANLTNLYLLPTSGGALHEWENGAWKKVYEERLTDTEAARVEHVMHEAIANAGVIDQTAQTWGERVEFRGAQVALSALGQKAPPEQKRAWDPTHEKRQKLQTFIAGRLPGFTVKMGGLTTIDVTKNGIDKAYGIHQLCRRLSIDEKDTLYIGDELRKGGNDEAVYKTNAQARAVSSPTETEHVILDLLSI